MRDVPIPDPDPVDLGPAMLACTLMQRRFVIGCVKSRGKSVARVARAAGYSDKGEACKVRAHGLMHNEKVLRALKEEADRHLDAIGSLAVFRLGDFMDSPDERVALESTNSAMDRAGYGRRTTQDIRVEHVDNRSTAELLEAMRQFQGQVVDVTPKRLEHVETET